MGSYQKDVDPVDGYTGCSVLRKSHSDKKFTFSLFVHSEQVSKELSEGNWSKVFEQKFADSSVNSICWAPHEFGLILAAAVSDGKVAIIEYNNGAW